MSDHREASDKEKQHLGRREFLQIASITALSSCAQGRGSPMSIPSVPLTNSPAPIATATSAIAGSSPTKPTPLITNAPAPAPSLGTSAPAPAPILSSAPAPTPIVTSVPSPTGTYLVIANRTSFPNSQVYVYAVSSGGYLLNNGTLVPETTALVPPLTLSDTGDTVIPLPLMGSARCYISLGSPLQLSKGVQPAFGANQPQLYDWFEFNYGRTANGTGSLFINTTQVDMFGLPMTLQIVWPGGSQTVGIPSGLRGAIFAAMRANGLGNLIVSSGGVDLRVIALSHGIGQGLVAATYMDAYANAVWEYYTTNTMMYNLGGKSVTAKTINGSLVFSDGTVVPKPVGLNVNGGAHGPFLVAGFNRSTLMPAQQPVLNPANFYQTTPTNVYSKIFHEYSIDGLAYGFSYDDFGGFSSTVAPPTTPTSITVTLSAF